MKLFEIDFGLLLIFVMAESEEEALVKIRDPASSIRKTYPEYNLNDTPDFIECSEDGILTSYGWD